jgi:hypothetical protein
VGRALAPGEATRQAYARRHEDCQPQLTLGGGMLGPARKLCTIVVATRETMESSAAEAVVQTLLRENAAFSLDASLFSNAAATDERRTRAPW